MKTTLLLLAPLALAACSAERDANEAPAPSPQSTQTAAIVDEIPVTLRGTWGINLADCDETRSDTKGMIDIGESEIGFYESRATLATVELAEDERLRAYFDFAGEGQTWSRGMDLTVEDQGATLVRRDFGGDALTNPLRYRRCTA